MFDIEIEIADPASEDPTDTITFLDDGVFLQLSQPGLASRDIIVMTAAQAEKLLLALDVALSEHRGEDE